MCDNGEKTVDVKESMVLMVSCIMHSGGGCTNS